MFSFFKLFRARTISGLTACKPTCLQHAAQIEFDNRLRARSTASRAGTLDRCIRRAPWSGEPVLKGCEGGQPSDAMLHTKFLP